MLNTQHDTATRNEPIPDTESVLATPSTTKSEQDNDKQFELSPEEQRKVLRKVDLRIIVVLGVINVISHLDRGTVSAVAIAGMIEDLELDIGNRYNIILLIFMAPYLIFEFISSIMARRVGARPLLMTICMLWGTVTIGSGLVKHWTQLLGLRVLLGTFEAAFFPMVVHLLSAWYTRYEVQKRYAAFVLVSVAIGSFSGILTYGLIQMEGLGGLRGWRWAFLMEGILTIVLGVAVTSLVIDFPDKARNSFKFLTNRQIDWIIFRLQQDRGDAEDEPFSSTKFFGAARHFPVWFYAIIFSCISTTINAVGFFLPLILRKDLGFSMAATFGLMTPPSLFGATMMLLWAYIGDKYRTRGPILIFNSVLSITGLAILGWAKSSGVRYFSIFIIVGGAMANGPTALAYQANNIRGQWVRAFASATMVIGSGSGGIFGALAFGDLNLTAAHNGVAGLIAANITIIVLVLILTAFFTRQNRLARQGKKLIFDHPGFIYSI